MMVWVALYLYFTGYVMLTWAAIDHMPNEPKWKIYVACLLWPIVVPWAAFFK